MDKNKNGLPYGDTQQMVHQGPGPCKKSVLQQQPMNQHESNEIIRIRKSKLHTSSNIFILLSTPSQLA